MNNMRTFSALSLAAAIGGIGCETSSERVQRGRGSNVNVTVNVNDGVNGTGSDAVSGQADGSTDVGSTDQGSNVVPPGQSVPLPDISNACVGEVPHISVIRSSQPFSGAEIYLSPVKEYSGADTARGFQSVQKSDGSHGLPTDPDPLKNVETTLPSELQGKAQIQVFTNLNPEQYQLHTISVTPISGKTDNFEGFYYVIQLNGATEEQAATDFRNALLAKDGGGLVKYQPRMNNFVTAGGGENSKFDVMLAPGESIVKITGLPNPDCVKDVDYSMNEARTSMRTLIAQLADREAVDSKI